MKKLLFLLAFLCCHTIVRSQGFLSSLDDDQKYIDSIVLVTKTSLSDSIKCLNSFRLSKLFLRARNNEKAAQYLKSANALKAKYPFLKDAAVYYNANTLFMKGDVKGCEKALVEANKRLKKYSVPEAYRLRAIILQNYGTMQQRRDNEKGYMNILVNEALPAAKKSGDNELIAILYKAISIIFMNMEKREKAALYFDMAEDYIEKAKKGSPTLAESQIKIYILKAENLVAMKQFEKAKKVLDKAFAKLSHYPKSNMNDSYLYVQGMYYAKKKQLQLALEIYEKGIRSAIKNNNIGDLVLLKYEEYKVLYKLKHYEKAKNNLLYLLENQDEIGISNTKDCYNELAKVYSTTGDYKNAFLYADKYKVLNDSLNKTKFENEIVELEVKYNKAENEKKITLLQSQNEKVVLEANNNRLTMMLFGVLSLLLLLTISFLWKWNQNQKKLSAQKEINYQQTVATLKNQQKLSVSQALLEGEEAERKRIARDLHDGLGSMLSGLKMHFNTAVKDTVHNNNNNNELNALIDKSIAELRTISQNLMPETLLQLGLEHALKDLCLSLATPKSKIEFQYLSNNIRLPQHYEIAIYRIIQELLNNALKYADASEILVACSRNQDIFFITVEDNGIGFDALAMEHSKGMGLRNIQNRVAFFEGKLEINTARSKGTAVYVELKIK